jgi:hypothetical protein
MKLFKSPAAILAEINKLRKAEQYRREDRSIVSNFFNGAPPLTDQEAEDLGFTINVNHLFGFKELTDASDQIFSLYTKPATLIEIELDAAPPGKRMEWGMQAALEASRVLKKIKGFKTAYQGVSGDGSMHGEALFFFPNATFPLPRQAPLSRMLVPDDASTDVSELTHFGIEAPMNLRDLRRYYERAPKGWNKANLGKLLTKIYEGSLDAGFAIDTTNLEELEYRRQENSATATNNERRRPGVDVTYFYQVRVDKPGCPLDLEISMTGERDGDKKDDAILYSGECVIPRAQACLHPFFMDCIIGGAPKWHRVMGLGDAQLSAQSRGRTAREPRTAGDRRGVHESVAGEGRGHARSGQQILMKHNGFCRRD